MEALIARDPALAGTVTTLYTSSGWSVVESTARGRASAVAFRLVGGRWRAVRTRAVSIQILGPHPGARGLGPITQVAMEVRAHTPFVETGLWIDGTYIVAQGGGTPTNGTIYGSPAHPLARGLHVAVGYARTATSGAAVAWTFTVS
jgi:hypothetical protein